ncbi:uncharacterized protein LOC112465908 [Temnothorax curvispinosus]|uniref:Uncharacterized protein LOC112465908 n=1 Tax=Temnothorax curvispinosus TaxID=300111 RepID=A0A6J1R4E8_9HYME|nr:uncharacterized protein LOC112465908 [Temnothorax curvispinosus]
MERMINERLIWWAEREKKFSSSQSGFRRGKSFADNLAKIVSDIRASLCVGEYTLAAFLDVSSAYDCVDYRIMLDKLIALDCPTGIVKFIANWLYRRKVRFIVNSREFVDRLVFKGLPQDAVLSPALYSLFTQGLCSDLPEGVEAVEFADDIGLYVSGPNRELLVEFCKSGYLDKNLSIRIGDCDVCNSGEAKFLGIWLDNSLKFHRQVQEVRGKVSKANSIIRYLCKMSKGMEVNTALMLYKSLVRSMTDYGSFIYFPRDSAFQLKLERAQYLGIRTALGFRNSTPNDVIIAEAKVRGLKDWAEMLGRNFINKLIAYNQNDLCQKL